MIEPQPVEALRRRRVRTITKERGRTRFAPSVARVTRRERNDAACEVSRLWKEHLSTPIELQWHLVPRVVVRGRLVSWSGPSPVIGVEIGVVELEWAGCGTRQSGVPRCA